MSVTKSELIERVSQKANVPKTKAESIVNLVFNAMTDALVKGERVEIRGFASWFVKEYKPYTGRNPKNGSIVQVEGKRLPFFKCGKELREKINKS